VIHAESNPSSDQDNGHEDRHESRFQQAAEIHGRDEHGRSFAFLNLPRTGVFYDALHGKILADMLSLGWIDSGSNPSPKLVRDKIVEGANKDVILTILCQLSYGGGSFANRAPSQSQVEFVGDLYEDTWQMYEEYRESEGLPLTEQDDDESMDQQSEDENPIEAVESNCGCRFCCSEECEPKAWNLDENDFGEHQFDAEICCKDDQGQPFAFLRLPTDGRFLETVHRRILPGVEGGSMVESRALRQIFRKIIVGQEKDRAMKPLGSTRFGAPPLDAALLREPNALLNCLYDETWKVYEECRTRWKLLGGNTTSGPGLDPFHGSQHHHETVCGEPAQGDGLSGTRMALTSDYRKEFTNVPFDFMGLPPELRTRVYEYALVPGSVSLRTCAHHMPNGTWPVLSPGLLTSNRQINQEAGGLLEENTLIVDVFFHDANPIIHPHQLPTHLLPKINGLVLIIDVAGYFLEVQMVPKYDWHQLQALTSLKHLRIVGVEQSTFSLSPGRWGEILTEVITRVPAGCKVEYGAEAELELAHVDDVARRTEKHEPCRVEEAWEMDVSMLEEAVSNLPATVVQGALSGVVSAPRDWHGEWKCEWEREERDADVTD